MRLYVLAGTRDLLRPEIVAPEVVSSLVGPGIKVVRAYWLWPESGDHYHDFLQDEPADNRNAVIAEAMKDGFGSRYQPLLVLADLLEECVAGAPVGNDNTVADRRAQLGVVSEILGSGYVRSLHLYGVSLPPDADPDGCWAEPAGIVTDSVRRQMEELRGELSSFLNEDAITSEVIAMTPELPAFRTVYNNAHCNQFARRLESRLRERGWVPDTDGVAGAISAILAAWDEQGMSLGSSLSRDHVEGMAELLFKKLLQD
jgi:hypothetical protein